MLQRNLVLALAAAGLVITAGCSGPECSERADCGTGMICDDENRCVPEAEQECPTECSGDTPICDADAGRCVACTEVEGCSNETPICDDGLCVACTELQGCSGETPICDDGLCVACTELQGCSGDTPHCDTSAAEPTCVECLESADCSDNHFGPYCAAGICESNDPGQTSDEIAAVRAAADGTGLSLPIRGAVATYVRPAAGDDPAGFFLQAEPTGPAIFVCHDSAAGPEVVPGARVSLIVDTITTVAEMRHVTAVSELEVVDTGVPVAPFVQDVSAAADLVTALADYESELVSLTGTLGASEAAGAGHVAARIETAGVDHAFLKLRMTESLWAELGLERGCTLTLRAGPMWRHNATAQPMGFVASDFTAIDCPEPPEYARLIITEVGPNIPQSHDLVELLVVTAGTTKQLTVVEDASSPQTLATFPDVVVEAGDIIVLHLNPTGDSPSASERHSKNESTAPGAFPDAWDFIGGSAGLTFSHRVLMVKTPEGEVQDAVAFVKSNIATPPAGFPDAVQAVQAIGHWSPADCGGEACTYESAISVLEICVDWKDVGNTRDSSMSRIADTNSKDDWVFRETGATFGLPNP